MKKQINEIKRMQLIAGLITESEYKKSLMNENNNISDEMKKAFGDQSYNAMNPSAPDWRDYEGYESLLEDYFNEYNIDNPEEFNAEIFDNGDLTNNLAFDIAKAGGFKGDLGDLIDSSDLNLYCNRLAKSFALQYGVDMGLIEKNDPQYQSEINRISKLLNDYETKMKQS